METNIDKHRLKKKRRKTHENMFKSNLYTSLKKGEGKQT